MIKTYAYAKINITFEVLGRRGDGYHDIVSILQEIDLKDTLQFESAASLTVVCDNVELRPSDNLVLKAAKLLKKECRYRGGAKIALKKGIPLAAGLGGGSSDAAAALVALNKLWKLELSTDALVDLAAELGSDVPYFIRGGTSLAEGRGERITPLPPLPQLWVVLLRPSVPVPESKTKEMYGALRPSHYSKGDYARKTAAFIESAVEGHQPPDSPNHGGIERIGGHPQAPVRKNPVPLFQGYNTFDAVAFEMYEGMEWYWKQFMAAGAAEVHLAGAGPMLFALTRDRAMAGKVHRSLKELGLETYLVKTVSRDD